MALLNFCYVMVQVFLGIFFVAVCIAALIAGIIILVLLFTPFPYFPLHRQFMIRFWTFAVTALFLDNHDEWDKVEEELKILASWETARSVYMIETKEEK